MNEKEFARFVKDGLGTPVVSQSLAIRIAVRIGNQTGSNSVQRSTTYGRRPVVGAAPVGHARRRAVTVWLAAAVAVLIGANLAAFQLFPVYRTALADAPVFGPATVNLLRNLGLGGSTTTGTASPVLPGVTPLAASAVADGVRLDLIAGYADTIRTILILKSPDSLVPFGRGVGGVDEMLLTDEAGHAYHGWASTGGDGQLILSFSAFTAGPGPDRLTLTIPAMYGNGPLVHVPGYPAGTKGEYPGPFVTGPWTLMFDLSAIAGERLAVPDPQTINGTTYTITDIRKSGPFVDIQWNVSGRAVDATVAANNSRTGMPSTSSGDAGTSDDFGSAKLYSPSGTRITIQSGNDTTTSQTSPVVQAAYLYRVEQAGTYRLVIGSSPAVTFRIKVS